METAVKALALKNGRLYSWWACEGWRKIYIPHEITYAIPGTKLFVFDTFQSCNDWLCLDHRPSKDTLEIWQVTCPDLEPLHQACDIWSWHSWMEWWHKRPAVSYDPHTSYRLPQHSYTPQGTCVTTELTLERKLWPLNT